MTGFLLSWLPLIAFFVSYKFYGLYLASAVVAAITLAVLLVHLISRKPLATWQLVNALLIIVMAGATLALRQTGFIKFKPTLFFSLFAIYLGAGYYFKFKTPLDALILEYIKPNRIASARAIVYFSWILSLAVLSVINALVALFASTNTWVNFKLFGASTALLLVNITLSYILYHKEYFTAAALSTSKERPKTLKRAERPKSRD